MNLLDRFKSIGSSKIALDLPVLAHWRLAAVALGIGIAALGQIVIMSNRVFDLPVLEPLADSIFGEVHRGKPTAVLLGVLMLVAGAALFAVSLSPAKREEDDLAQAGGPASSTLDGGDRRLVLLILGLGLALSAGLWLLLARGNYEGIYPWVWALGIAVVAVAFLVWDRRGGVNLKLSIRPLEAVFLLAATGGFIALNVWDLGSWYYSVIGDEYTIYFHTVQVAQGEQANFFSLHGAYGILPVAETYYRVAVMDIFGVDYFSWRLASVLAGAALLAPIYFLVRGRFGVVAAIAAVVLAGTAHMHLAYSHTGYSTTFVLVPTVVAFVLFFSAARRGSLALMFGAGVAAGLGFYVLYNARILLPLLLLPLLLYRGRFDMRRNVPPLLLGFTMVVVPMLIVANWDIVSFATDESVFNANSRVHDTAWGAIRDNVLRNTLAFNYNGKSIHFISGSLLEPITAVLALLGLAYALRRAMRPTYFVLLTWFGVAMVTSGWMAFHFFVPVIRMSFLMPIVVVFAALALAKSYELLRDAIGNDVLRAAVPPMMLAVVLAGVVGSNLYRFYEATPSSTRTLPSGLVMKAVLSGECRDSERPTVVVSPLGQDDLAGLAIRSRDWGDDLVPVILGYDEMQRVKEFTPVSCVVYRPESEPPSDGNLTRLQQLAGTRTLVSEYDGVGQNRVVVLR